MGSDSWDADDWPRDWGEYGGPYPDTNPNAYYPFSTCGWCQRQFIETIAIQRKPHIEECRVLFFCFEQQETGAEFGSTFPSFEAKLKWVQIHEDERFRRDLLDLLACLS